MLKGLRASSTGWAINYQSERAGVTPKSDRSRVHIVRELERASISMLQSKAHKIMAEVIKKARDPSGAVSHLAQASTDSKTQQRRLNEEGFCIDTTRPVERAAIAASTSNLRMSETDSL